VAVAVLPVAEGDQGDVSYNEDSTIVEERDLETAVYLSLWCNAPALPDDDAPDGGTRQGFWADALQSEGDVWGSRLWLLARSKLTDDALVDAKTYAEEALAWLVHDGVARAVTVTASRTDLTPETKGILIDVLIYKPNGERPEFSWAWDQLRGTVH
jgi:phage gp46-like protein